MARLDATSRVPITVLILITTFALAYVGVIRAVGCVLDLDQVVKTLSVSGVILSSLAVVTAHALEAPIS